jgi:hypothetical protein
VITGGWGSWSRWLRVDERGLLLSLYAATLASGLFMYLYEPATAIVIMLPLLMGALTLSPRHIPAFVATVIVVLLAQTLVSWGLDVPARRVLALLVALAMVGVVLMFNRRRSDLGVAGWASDDLLKELHVRLRRQAVMPTLPEGWRAESHLRAAGGTQFAGDFLLTHLEPGERLRLLVVDVSGKGVAAGPKSLLLSGAFGSLLASTEPAEFLSEANGYVCRQGWPEGFATAIQLTLDLATGDFVLRSAGHPPAVQLHAGSGRWTVHEGYEGTVLGLVEDETYDAVVGRMMPGDVLLLFTDGMVERPGRDMSDGIDTLIGEMERAVHRDVDGVARDLVDRFGAEGDDCALVVVRRSTHVVAGPGSAGLAQRVGEARSG